MLILFFFLLVLPYSDWLVIFLLLPFQSIRNRYLRNQNSKFSLPIKLMVVLFGLWERIFRGGWERYMLFKVGMIPSCHLRKFIYKLIGVEMDRDVIFHFKTEIRCPWRLSVGKGTIIGDNALLDARNGLTLGKNVNLSSNVSIYTEQHDHRDPYFECTERCKRPVMIHDRVWVGSNVIILPGVTIGEGAVCCAGCVVTKDIPPYSVVAGIPAKVVNKRPDDLRYSFNGKSCRLY